MPRGRIYKHPTKAMHLNLPVPLHQALMRWSKATGVPASRFVVAMLSENLEAIEAMADAVEAAKDGQLESVQTIRGLLLGAINGAQELADSIDPNKKGDA